ncbi:MAG TPA: hypothetical protein VHY08_06325, partial [Bacillota bacterium]|nr:hypothetical protein [Bacillota bacterium]
MKSTRIYLFMALLIFLIPTVAFTKGSWKTLKTEHFTVFYTTQFEAEAWQCLKILEYYRPEVEKISGNKAAHLSVVIDDTGTLVNGYSNAIANQLHLFKYPPQGGWAGVENWWSMVGVHEYTHHLTLAKTGGMPGFIAKIFGNNLLLFPLPNLVAPGWVIEGITVYNESQLSPFQ